MVYINQYYKTNYGYFDDNLETAKAMTYFYTSHGYNAILEPSLDSDLYYVLLQKNHRILKPPIVFTGKF